MSADQLPAAGGYWGMAEPWSQERICACPVGREALDLSQVPVPPSLPLEAVWKNNTKETEGAASYNGSSAPLPLEEQLFPVSEQEGQPRPPESI